MSVVDDKGEYSWYNIDRVYDHLLSLGVRPIVELSFMPKFLANCSDCPSQQGNPRQCYYAFSSPGSYKGLTQPPQHFGDWYRLVRALAAHLVDRHGIAEVAQWHFECVHPSAVRSVFVLSPLTAGAPAAQGVERDVDVRLPRLLPPALRSFRPRPQGHPPIAARRRPELAADSERARSHQRHGSARYPAGLHLHAFLQLGSELHVERDAVGKGSGLLQPGGTGGAVLGRRCRTAVLAHGDERRVFRPRQSLRGILPDHTDPEADLA